MSSSRTESWFTIVSSKRWVAYLLLVVVFATTCVGLSVWQFNRRAEAQVEISRVMANYNQTPVPIGVLLPDPDSFNPDDKWLPVEVTGTYLSEQQLIVRSRPRDGQAGVEVLTPLKTTDGKIFIIDRGWLPANADAEQPYDIPSPPEGEVTVIARVKAGEPAIPGREMSNGQVATIELPLIEEFLGESTYTGAYGLLVSEDPQSPETAPLANETPSLDEGAHLSYALQWIMFGVLAFVALIWAIRNELKVRRGTTTTSKRKKLSEEEIEDLILDATH